MKLPGSDTKRTATGIDGFFASIADQHDRFFVWLFRNWPQSGAIASTRPNAPHNITRNFTKRVDEKLKEQREQKEKTPPPEPCNCNCVGCNHGDRHCNGKYCGTVREPKNTGPQQQRPRGQHPRPLTRGATNTPTPQPGERTGYAWPRPRAKAQT